MTSPDRLIYDPIYARVKREPVERTYSIQIKGEQHTWLIDAWTKLSYTQLCQILSDLTGYTTGFLSGVLPERFDDLGYATQKLSIAQEGEAPMFLIRSSDGGKP